METNDQLKIKVACARIAMLMEHQQVVSDLKEIAADIKPNNEYLMGAQDALAYLIGFLEEKGCG